MKYRAYIVRNPQICGGAPTVKGTRVTVRTVLASLAEGATVSEIRADFPTLTEDAIRAVIAFAAESAAELKNLLVKSRKAAQRSSVTPADVGKAVILERKHR